MGLLVDPGAHDNLIGSRTVDRINRICARHGLSCEFSPLPQTKSVGGVGKGAQFCVLKTKVPTALPGGHRTHYNAPVVPDSDLPGLLGNQTLMRNRAVMDVGRGILWFCGPGTIHFQPPPGSIEMKLELSPSGHWMLPITEYKQESDHQSSAPSHLMSGRTDSSVLPDCSGGTDSSVPSEI